MNAIIRKCPILLPALVLLSACATVPSVDFPKESRIKSIAMIRIGEPDANAVVNLGGASGAFGLVGGLVQAGLNDFHTKSYTEQIKARHVAFGELLQAKMVENLESSGYVITILDQRPPRPRSGGPVDYSGIHVDTDAILHVWFWALGYVSPPSKVNFQPWFMARIELIDSTSRKDVYFKTFACGYAPKLDNIVYVPADARYEYDSFDHLMADFDGSVAGLTACGEAIASIVREDFARR